MVGTRKLQEQDVKEKRPATDFFGQWFGAQHDGGDGVPHGHVRRHIDLLGRVPHGPPHGPVDECIDVTDNAHGPQEGGDQYHRAGSDGENRDDGSRHGTEGHQRHRTFIGLLFLGDDQGAKEYENCD